MAQPGLILWQHGDYAYSVDGSPDWSSDDAIVSGGTPRFKPDMNQLLACRCHHLLVGYIPEGEDITVTATAYPGSPDKRWTVKPWVGKYLTVKVALIVTAGSGNIYVKAEHEGPVSTKTTITTFQTNSTALTHLNATFDVSNIGGNDRRGDEGYFNLYLKVDTGVTAKIKGMVAFQLDDIASGTYTLD
jgi:hypothetical protein